MSEHQEVAEQCAICERVRLLGEDKFIAGPAPSDPIAYVGARISICPDCLASKKASSGDGLCGGSGERTMSMKPGWDERDYKLWSLIKQLPSYGTVAGKGNKLIALNSVVALMEEQAKKRDAGPSDGSLRKVK